VALELVDQMKILHNCKLDDVVVACGSGGMLSGLVVALKDSAVNVYGAEPEEGGADDVLRGRRAGRRVERVHSLSIADGLRCPLGLLP
jgi:threonine dehydratase